jgi:MFS transporter, PAT family, beta-lactamase induction signal transducer AmpG
MKAIFSVFASRQMFLLLLMGFSSGLPLALTGATLQAWMKDEQVDLTVIGLFSLVGLPYALKFLWSPFMDRFVPPFLGRRRGWMLICQLALIVVIVLLGNTHPSQDPTLIAVLALMITFASASQDIVIDAYRAEILEREELGAGAGVAILGYRLGMLTSGALALFLADHLPWSIVYSLISCTLLIGVIATFASPEPAASQTAPKSLREAVIEPLLDYFGRHGAFEILVFIVLYKIGEVMAVALSTPFMLQLGFSKTEIAAVTKLFGLIATISGSLIGGGWTVRLGMKKALLLFGLCQAVAPFCYATLSLLGHNHTAMAIAVGADNFFAGLATAPFIAFLMSLCNKRFTATQYALLTSIAAVCRVFAGAPTGFMVEAMGWPAFFVLCAFASAPGLTLLALRYDSWAEPAEHGVS